MAGTGGLRVTVKVDSEPATDAFKAARRDVNKRVKEGLRIAGEREALPLAKRLAPRRTGRLAGSLVVKSTARSAALTTNIRGKEGRRVGLLEFGGTVRGRIEPKAARRARGRAALNTPEGPRAAVNKPRTYRAQRFLNRAVEQRQPQIREAIQEEILKAFRPPLEVG